MTLKQFTIALVLQLPLMLALGSGCRHVAGSDEGDVLPDGGVAFTCANMTSNVIFFDGDKDIMSSSGGVISDFIHPGMEYITDGTWGATTKRDADGGVRHVTISTKPTGVGWVLEFGTDELGRPLTPGQYPDAERAAFTGGHAGLEIGSPNGGCNTLTGSFNVAEITVGDGGVLNSFTADFVQHCEKLEAALRGCVHYEHP